MCKRAVPLALAALALAGCVDLPPSRQEPNYRPAYPAMAPAEAPTSGALYQAGYGISLFDDRRAMRVGDVVTILLQEKTQSSKAAGTTINKDTTSTMPEPTLLGSTVNGLGAGNSMTDIESSHKFDGAAKSDQSNSLTGTISAVVTNVYPNGLLLVQGEKWLKLNRGEEYVQVSGLVRREDVDGANVVSSLRLADARFTYSGTGEVANSNAPGWLARFFLSPWMPF